VSEAFASLAVWLGGEEPGLRHPGALLLVGLAVWAALRLLRRRPERIPWPAFPEAEAASGRRPGSEAPLRAAREAPLRAAREAPLRAALRALAIAALAVVAAGPVTRRAAAPPPELGLDLILVLDASGSMRALDAEFEGEWRTRLELARTVVSRFARRRAASGDRVGLVVFGQHAFTQCPLTRDGGLLAASLARVQPGVAGENTALGDALALAVKRVSGRSEAKPGTRVVVLLTDGRSNVGEIPVDVAVELARVRGVRVHTVGIGGEGRVPIDRAESAAGRGLHFARHDLDADTLTFIASRTGGRFFRARRPADLAEVYEAIDALERTERPAQGRSLETPRPEAWLAVAGGLVALELLGLSVLRRPVP